MNTRVLVIVTICFSAILGGCTSIEPSTFNDHMTHDESYLSGDVTCTDILKNELYPMWDSYDSGAISSNQCHMNTHMITRAIMKSCGSDFVTQNIQPTCRNAMIHGMMEGYIQINNSNDNIGNLASEYCENTFMVDSLQYRECIHGIGNGFILVDNLDKDKAILDCETLSDDLISTCVSGVYGGLFRYDFDTKRSTNYCIGEKYSNICRLYIAAYFDAEVDNESDRCSIAESKDMCGYGVGIMQSREFDNNIDKIAEICQTNTCVDGAIFEAKRVGKDNIVPKLEILMK